MSNDHRAIGATSGPISRRAVESQRSTRTSDHPVHADDGTAHPPCSSRHASPAAEWDSWKPARDLS
jgi:hypothetical protein